MTTFTPLRVRSHGSLLYGVVAPEALLQRALDAGYRALALTDRDNLYLAIRFYQAARAEGLQPLLGVELTVGADSLLLLAIDRRGYGNLCSLVTRRRLDADFDAVAALGALSGGLHVVAESPGLAASLLAAGVPVAGGRRPGATPSRGSSGGLWFGIRGVAAERPRLRERLEAARWLGVPPVATGDWLLGTRADHDTHRVAVTAAAGELLDRMPAGAFGSADALVAPPAAWARRIEQVCAAAGVPDAVAPALANNVALVERCRLELELGLPIFPRAPVPAGETGPGYLLRLGRAGVGRRYRRGAARSLRGAAQTRLQAELAMIERLGFTGYFLLVADIVEFARGRGIPTVGRGSGAGSLVAYVLGITNVDPLRHGLYFERFLHPARRDCPDLDIDLCWQRRDEVIAHVYATYGAGQVAMISTHATLGARSAFRETAKVLGVPNARVNLLARRIPRSLDAPYLPRLTSLPEARGVDWREPVLRRALELAEPLAGAPRHLSIHCGGVVIGDRPLTWYTPLERAAKGIVVTQFEMRAIEAIGLVKMDLLGNRALSTIAECVTLAARRGVVLDVDSLPDPDPATADRLAAGDTLNCFQLESPAMRNLLRMLAARALDEVIAAVALVRPGPAESGMKEAFCRRHRGLEPASCLHPRLAPVLAGTHGVLLYEEDVMRVAAALTGLPLHEGDELRRAIGAAGSDEERAALERGFLHLALQAGVGEPTARAVWRDLARFGAYAFCKAHAAGYGVLAYQCAYLKTHAPVEFAVAILNHHAGMYATWVHVEDLRRQGVRFLAPCVRHSAWATTLEAGAGAGAGTGAGAGADAPVGAQAEKAGEVPQPRPEAPREPGMAERRLASGRARMMRARAAAQGASPVFSAPPPTGSVRVGLSRVYGLAEATGQRIVAERGARAFTSLADFVDRVRPTLPEVESLVRAGAFDWTARTRPSLLLEARAGATSWKRLPVRAPVLAGTDGAALPCEPAAPVAVPSLPEFDPGDRARHEFEASGLWFSADPLATWVPADARRGATPASGIAGRSGQRITVVGMVCARRRLATKSGETMLFLTLADRSGLAECVLFPQAYRALAAATRGCILRATGRVGETLDSATLHVDALETLVEAVSIPEPADAPDR